MKINTPSKKPTKKTFLILAIILLLAITLYAVYARANDAWPFVSSTEESAGTDDGINYSSPTDEEADAGLEAKKRSVEVDEGANGSSGSTSTPSDSTTSNKKSVNVLITSLNQNENNDLDVRTSISTIEADGECTLTLTKDGSSTITQRAETQVITGYSACSGFIVPASQLSNGTWTAQLAYEGRSTTGSTSATVEIKK